MQKKTKDYVMDKTKGIGDVKASQRYQSLDNYLKKNQGMNELVGHSLGASETSINFDVPPPALENLIPPPPGLENLLSADSSFSEVEESSQPSATESGTESCKSSFAGSFAHQIGAVTYQKEPAGTQHLRKQLVKKSMNVCQPL